jgi:ABC-type dipeptide/oligopeptide/nickel transport system permease component
MRRYVIKRVLLMIPSLLIVSFIVFSLARLIPGDVVDMMFEDQAYAKDIEEMRRKLGIDRPIHLQYVAWIAKIVRGDFGVSLWTKKPVSEEILARLPVSLELGLLTIGCALLMAVPIGILAAVRQDTLQDYTARSLAIGGLSVPGFWLATLVVVLPSIWGDLPRARLGPARLRYALGAELSHPNDHQFYLQPVVSPQGGTGRSDWPAPAGGGSPRELDATGRCDLSLQAARRCPLARQTAREQPGVGGG